MTGWSQIERSPQQLGAVWLRENGGYELTRRTERVSSIRACGSPRDCAEHGKEAPLDSLDYRVALRSIVILVRKRQGL